MAGSCYANTDDHFLNLTGCDPPGPTTTYNAQYIADVTLPDTSIIQPGQSVNKIWTMRNTGTRSWGAGVQLVFLRGNRLGAPASVSVPTLAPGQQGNLSVPLQIPENLSPGTYEGYWRLRNPAGTYFGDEIWFRLSTGNSQPPGGNGSSAENPVVIAPAVVGPGESFRPKVEIRVSSGMLSESMGHMLRFRGGSNYSGFPHVAVRGTVASGQIAIFEFTTDHPFIAPESDGTYESRWQIWANNGWIGPEITIRFTVSHYPNGHPPQRPSLTSPADWAVIVGQPPQLCAQHNGDPDGDCQSSPGWGSPAKNVMLRSIVLRFDLGFFLNTATGRSGSHSLRKTQYRAERDT